MMIGTPRFSLPDHIEAAAEDWYDWKGWKSQHHDCLYKLATVRLWCIYSGHGTYFYCANANRFHAGLPLVRHTRIVSPSDKLSNCVARYIPIRAVLGYPLPNNNTPFGQSSDTWAQVVANVAPLMALVGERNAKEYMRNASS